MSHVYARMDCKRALLPSPSSDQARPLCVTRLVVCVARIVDWVLANIERGSVESDVVPGQRFALDRCALLQGSWCGEAEIALGDEAEERGRCDQGRMEGAVIYRLSGKWMATCASKSTLTGFEGVTLCSKYRWEPVFLMVSRQAKSPSKLPD